jgi:hypothetical protein
MYPHIQGIHHHSEQLDTEEIFWLAAVADREERARALLENMVQEQHGRAGQTPEHASTLHAGARSS